MLSLKKYNERNRPGRCGLTYERAGAHRNESAHKKLAFGVKPTIELV